MIKRVPPFLYAVMPFGLMTVLLFQGMEAAFDLFWVIFPFIPMLVLPIALTGQLRLGWSFLGVGLLTVADWVPGDPITSLGLWVNAQFDLGAIPQATGLATLAIGIWGILAVSLFVGRTLARIVGLVGLSAMMGAFVLFHLVTITIPMQALQREVQSRSAQIFNDCVFCGEGSIGRVLEDVGGLSERLDRTVKDFALQPVGAVYCWIESGVDTVSMQEVCVRRNNDGVGVAVNPSVYEVMVVPMRLGFVLLALSFMAIWNAGLVYVIYRHGPLRLSGGVWARN